MMMMIIIIMHHLLPADNLVFPFFSPAERFAEVKRDFNRVTLAGSPLKGNTAELFTLLRAPPSGSDTFQKVFREMTHDLPGFFVTRSYCTHTYTGFLKKNKFKL